MINIENNAVNQELIMSIVKSSDILALDLSVRSHNALKRAFINTIGELCNATQLDLLRSKYMSIRSVEEIQKKLNEIGLSLKPLDFKIATRHDCKKLQPLSDVSISFDVSVQLSKEQYEILKRGNIPNDMDQWFIFYEKGLLHFCRYSGICYFTVALDELSGLHHVKTYVYDLDNISNWKENASEMIRSILIRYSDF